VLALVVSPFTYHSPQAQKIGTIFWWVVIQGLAIFVIVLAWTIYNLSKYRQRPGQGPPYQLRDIPKLEYFWIALPILSLAAIFTYEVRIMPDIAPPEGYGRRFPQKPDMTVTGHQWWWEVEYSNGAKASDEIHIPAGRRMLVRLESADVIHDFWVEQLGPKMDTVPGYPSYIWLQADSPGVYQGQCSEFCGAQHAWMLFLVVAEPRAKFERYIDALAEPAPPPQTDAAKKGFQLFFKMPCWRCHAIRGTGAKGTLGPDLTHVGSRYRLGSGILYNTPENMRLWMRDPPAVKPGIRMPNFHFSPDQVNEIAAYLESLK